MAACDPLTRQTGPTCKCVHLFKGGWCSSRLKRRAERPSLPAVLVIQRFVVPSPLPAPAQG